MESRSSRARNSTAGSAASSSRKVRKSSKQSTSTLRAQSRAGKGSGESITTSTTASERISLRHTTLEREAEAESSALSCTSCILGALHVIDVGLGVACIVYGGMVHVVSAMATCISYGLLLVIGSIAGAIGYCSGGRSKRSPGLMVSAMAGFMISLMNVAAFVAILVSWDPFIDFLKDYQEALLLTEDSIETIQGMKIPLVIIFVVLACLEMYRGVAMFRMMKTNTTLAGDGRSSRGGRRLSQPDSDSGQSDTKSSWVLSWLGVTKKKRTDDLVLFDDNSSLDSALLWSNSGEPCPEDYLVFVPEHERSLTNFTASLSLPMPPEDKMDY